LYAPPRSSVAPPSATARAVCSVCSRDQGEMLAADVPTIDVEDGALAVGHLGRGELVRLEDRHDAVDPGLTLEPQALDVDVLLDVADRADHVQARALDAVSARAGSLDPLDDGPHLLLRRSLLHHYHHRFILSTRARRRQDRERRLLPPLRGARSRKGPHAAVPVHGRRQAEAPS
jgi:hypothetical protein